jgi:hypothetical protein
MEVVGAGRDDILGLGGLGGILEFGSSFLQVKSSQVKSSRFSFACKQLHCND